MEYKLNTTKDYKDPYDKFWKNAQEEGYFKKKELQKKYLNQLVKEVNQILNEKKEIKKVIDLGCGAGEVLIALKDINKKTKLIGFDTSSNAIKIAKSNIKNKNRKILFKKIENDMETFFKEIEKKEPFILLSMGHTIPHILNYKKFIKEINNSKMIGAIFEIHENWQDSINYIRKGKNKVDFFGEEKGKKVFLVTQKNDSNTVWRGHMIEEFQKSKNLIWIAKTKQIQKGTKEIKKDFSQCLKLVKTYNTETKWGKMNRFVFIK